MRLAKKNNFYPNAESIIEKMLKKSGLSQNRFAEEILGIKGVNITRAKQSKKIPDGWFVACHEKLGLSKEELCQYEGALASGATLPELEQVFWGSTSEISNKIADIMQEENKTGESELCTLLLHQKDLPMARYYQNLAHLDAGILQEIQTWLNEMENGLPGYRGWFRLEFQKRFPEFEAWKQKILGEESA